MKSVIRNENIAVKLVQRSLGDNSGLRTKVLSTLTNIQIIFSSPLVTKCLLTSSVLYMPIPQPPAGKSKTSHSLLLLPSAGENTILNLPGWSTTKSVALYCRRTKKGQLEEDSPETTLASLQSFQPHAPQCVSPTWSPKACLPIVMGCVQPGTSLGMFLQTIGSRNTVPPRMFLMVPLGLFHIFFRPNSTCKNYIKVREASQPSVWSMCALRGFWKQNWDGWFLKVHNVGLTNIKCCRMFLLWDS